MRRIGDEFTGISNQLDSVIEEVIARRSAGEDVPDSDIEQAYPHLLPQLAERLSTLRAIEAARLAARSGDDNKDDDEFTFLDEDFEFLREELSGYEILEQVEYGGQGVVYKAIQKATKRMVAIKVLLDGPLASKRQRYRFAREVELASRARHPNIVTLYESGSIRGRPYFAMEFVEGIPINDYVLLHDLSMEDTVRLFVKVCHAVSTAHQRGIIHRDLKPSNILVDLDGEPHILDFGLAKDVSESEDEQPMVSLVGQVVGTLPYLSPEQVTARGEIDIRTDIYSLGVVLYQLLVGFFPYSVNGDREAVKDSILNCEPRSFRKALLAEYPQEPLPPAAFADDLEAVVFKALEKEKERRYQSVASLAEDLERYLRGDAVEVKSDRRLYLLKKTLRRYRVAAIVSAAFVVLLVGSLVGVTIAWRRAERVAAISQAGLQMGSYLKLGSVERDEGRVDQGVSMFEKAIEIYEAMPSDDPIVLRYLGGTYQRLATVYLEKNDYEKATEYIDAIIGLAHEILNRDPGNEEWLRMLAMATSLRGKVYYQQEKFDSANHEFGESELMLAELERKYPGNQSLKRGRLDTLHWGAKTEYKLGLVDSSLMKYKQIVDIHESLISNKVNSISATLDYCESLINLAAVHMRLKTAQDDSIAVNCLYKSLENLPRSVGDEYSSQRKKAVLIAIQSNSSIISERIISRMYFWRNTD